MGRADDSGRTSGSSLVTTRQLREAATVSGGGPSGSLLRGDTSQPRSCAGSVPPASPSRASRGGAAGGSGSSGGDPGRVLPPAGRAECGELPAEPPPPLPAPSRRVRPGPPPPARFAAGAPPAALGSSRRGDRQRGGSHEPSRAEPAPSQASVAPRR